MEKIIIAIVIITFLFKVYKNFKKEMQEAAERSKKAAEALKGKKQSVPPVYYPSDLEETVAQENKPAPVFESNKDDYMKEKAKQKLEKEAKRKKPVYDYYNPEIPAAEVLEGRRIHQPHNHGFKIAKKEKHVAADFNFRQALIYDAILRRPNY